MVLDNTIPNFHQEVLSDKAKIRDFYYQDRPLCAYALGDLDEEMWEISTFTGAFDSDKLASVALVWRGGELPVLIVVGDEQGAASLLMADDMPKEVFYMLPSKLLKPLQANYNLQSMRRLWRMVVNPSEFVSGPPHANLRRLTGDDASAVNNLFKQDLARREVTADTIENGTFFGIDDGGEIVALAGTHIYSESEGVGVIGYVYTAPSQRGRGLGTATAGAVAKELITRGIDHVVLNVEQDNSAAVRAYQKLGFRIHAPIVDGVAVRKA